MTIRCLDSASMDFFSYLKHTKFNYDAIDFWTNSIFIVGFAKQTQQMSITTSDVMVPEHLSMNLIMNLIRTHQRNLINYEYSNWNESSIRFDH